MKTNENKPRYKLSRWILLIYQRMVFSDVQPSQLLEVCADVLEAEVERLSARKKSDLKHKNTYKEMPSKPQFIRCHAKLTKGGRCKNIAVDGYENCKRHVFDDVLVWEEEQKVPSQTNESESKEEETKNNPERNKVVLPPNAVLLRRHPKTDLIYWPNTVYVVKSFADPVVIAKEAGPEYLVPLTEFDKAYLRTHHIPFRQIDLKFKGDKQPPWEVIKQEFQKLIKHEIQHQDGDKNGDKNKHDLVDTLTNQFGLRSNDKYYNDYSIDSPTLAPANDLFLKLAQLESNNSDDENFCL